MRHLAAFLGILALLSASPAFAFFEELDKLRKDVSALELLQKSATSSAGAAAQATASDFFDVPQDAWFAPFVMALAKVNVLSGYSKNGQPLHLFGPTDPVTVGELFKMAFKSAKVDAATCGGTPQNPAAQTHWSHDYFACAEKKSVRFALSFPRPDDPALRGDVVGAVLDAFSIPSLPVPSLFSDTLGHPEEDRIAQAAQMGIVSGYGDGRFGPYDRVQRAQAAKIIFKTIEWKVRMMK